MWITTTTGKYFYDPHTDGEVPMIGQDWILPSGDNLGRVQSVGVLRQNTAYGSQQASTASFGTPANDPWGNNPQTPQTGSYDQTAPF